MDTKQLSNEHPVTDNSSVQIPDFLLIPLVEAAFNVIKKIEDHQVPSSLRRIANFDSKALGHSTARTQVIQSLIVNSEFAKLAEDELFERTEVRSAYDQWDQDKAHDLIADAATRNDLPLLASILWIKKPRNYEFALGLIVAYSTVAMLENEQRESQRAQETKLLHLQNTLESEKSKAELLKADLDRVQEELSQERRSRRSREQKFETQIAMLQKQVDNNDQVTQRLKEARDRQSQRVEREASRAQELEARLKNANDEATRKSEKIAQLQNQLASALSSDMSLDYEDLQSLINAQKEADDISKTLLKIMNKSRSILSKDKPSSTQTQVRPQSSSSEPASAAKRAPVQIPQGLSITSPQALKEIFSQDDLMVLIDGYNVSLNNFQNLSLELQRERTISCATNVESRYHPSCVVVFDGQSSTTRGRVQSKVHVVFSPQDTTADDVIIERIKVTPPDRPIIVVSSDKNLAARAKGLGCEIITSEAFVNFAG